MSKIGVLTDSTNDLPEEIINKYDFLDIIPLTVHFGDEQFVDGEDITSEEFFKKIKNGDTIPTTSQPSAGAFIEKYRAMAEKHDQIISIHISGELSGTIKSAHLGASEFTELNIEIIDSNSTTLGLGSLVRLACQMVEDGYEIEEIVKAVEESKEKLSVLFTVSDLNFLEKGGRIGKAQSFVGSILNFHPLLEVVGTRGVVNPLDRARGRKKVEQKMVDYVKERIENEKAVWIGIVHGFSKERADQLRDSLQELCKEEQVEAKFMESIISPVLGAHVGHSVYGFSIITGDRLL
ncbi:MAG: DegV family protein [Bacillota bacterium]